MRKHKPAGMKYTNSRRAASQGQLLLQGVSWLFVCLALQCCLAAPAQPLSTYFATTHIVDNLLLQLQLMGVQLAAQLTLLDRQFLLGLLQLSVQRLDVSLAMAATGGQPRAAVMAEMCLSLMAVMAIFQQ